MSITKKSVTLPLSKTVYQTFSFQGCTSAMIAANPSIRNWYLNEIFILQCNKFFLNGGFSSPEVLIRATLQSDCPYMEFETVSLKYLEGALHSVIKSMIDAGYYIYFNNLDDYYVPGKCWYKQWHFAHDGMIFGYNQNAHTYDILSYDENWIFQPYKTPQRAVEKGFRSCAESNTHGLLFVMKPRSVIVDLNPKTILITLKEYLQSTLENDPPDIGDHAFGIVVHDYVAKYLDLLYNEFYPHERMDRRVFRMIWEHKVVMLERLQAVEKKLKMDNEISQRYLPVVQEANKLRMMYASHFMKPRKSLLPSIKNELISLKKTEEEILVEFTKKIENTI